MEDTPFIIEPPPKFEGNDEFQHWIRRFYDGFLKTNSNSGEVHVKWFGATGDGSTDDTVAIQAAIDSVPTKGIVVFEAGANYVITGNPALTFDGDISIDFNNCTFSYAQDNTAIQIGDTSSATFENWINGHVRVLRTATISHDGTETAASQLLGTAIKFVNLWSWKVRGPMYVRGFKYGYYFEGNSTGMTASEFHELQSQDCLIDFYMKPTTAGGYVTALDFYSIYAVLNTAHYSSVADSRIIETDQNSLTVDGINFYGGVCETAKERKIKHDGNWSSFNNLYYDVSNSGTDIELTSDSNNNLIKGGAALRLQVVSDSGTLNSIEAPHHVQFGMTQPILTVTPWGSTYPGTSVFTYARAALADDGYTDLPDATSGIVIASCNAESGLWAVQSDGTVTLLVGSANVTNDGTDTNFSVYDVGTNARVINRLGATGRIDVVYFYH